MCSTPLQAIDNTTCTNEAVIFSKPIFRITVAQQCLEEKRVFTCAEVWPGNALGSLGTPHHRRHDLAQLGLEHTVAAGVQDGRPAVARKARQGCAAWSIPGLVLLAAGDGERFP